MTDKEILNNWQKGIFDKEFKYGIVLYDNILYLVNYHKNIILEKVYMNRNGGFVRGLNSYTPESRKIISEMIEKLFF
jgi:hypothetical protein